MSCALALTFLFFRSNSNHREAPSFPLGQLNSTGPTSAHASHRWGLKAYMVERKGEHCMRGDDPRRVHVILSNSDPRWSLPVGHMLHRSSGSTAAITIHWQARRGEISWLVVHACVCCWAFLPTKAFCVLNRHWSVNISWRSRTPRIPHRTSQEVVQVYKILTGKVCTGKEVCTFTVPQYVFAWRASLDGPVGSCRAVFAQL